MSRKLYYVQYFLYAFIISHWISSLKRFGPMLFQSAGLHQSLFRLLNRGEQGISFGSLLLHKLVQLLHAFNLMIPQNSSVFDICFRL